MSALRNKTVVLVEDSIEDYMLISEGIQKLDPGMKILHFENGDEAGDYFDSLSQASEELPNLIILDVNIPGISGPDILQVIQGHPSHSHIPKVILSSSDYRKDVERSYEAGASCYVKKPLNPYKMIEAVDKICDFWLKTSISVVGIKREL